MHFSSASIMSLATVSVCPIYVAAKKQIQDRAEKNRGLIGTAASRRSIERERALKSKSKSKSKKGDNNNECLPDYLMVRNLFGSSGSSKSKSSKGSGDSCDLGCDTSCLMNSNFESEFFRAQEACLGSKDESLKVGRASCNGEDACVDAELNAEVGDRSCIGEMACAYLQEDVKIGNDACIGTFLETSYGDISFTSSACYNLFPGTVIGNGSCVGVCSLPSPSSTDTALIGVLSCIGEVGCADLKGSVEIGDQSCHGDKACNKLGSSGEVTKIGFGSCHGDEACEELGQNTGAIVGDASCFGNSACFNSYGLESIGDGSCHDAQSCRDLGSSSPDNPVTIGDTACRGYQACFQVSFAAVGDSSCIGYDACEQFNYNSGSLKTIGEKSCIGNRACFQLNGADVGCGSCIGGYACPYIYYNIGNNACVGEQACCDPYLPGETSGEVPDGECNRVTGTWVEECNTCLGKKERVPEREW